MNALSTLDQIAQDLEYDPNSKRIKKLIFCTCKKVGANDEEKLDRYTFQELIHELYNLNPTIDYLNYTLTQVVNTLNKPAEYAIIANIILNKLDTLYVISNDEATGIIFNQPTQPEETEIISNPPQPQISSTSHYLESATTDQTKYEYNQFDVRQNLMRYTNPLRAKIVIFSALYHRFTFQKEDWLKLKSIELDILLEKLFDACPTMREFEYRLNNSVIYMGNSDENIQAASTIIRFMKSFYGDISVNPNQYSSSETRPLDSSYRQSTLTTFDELDEYDIDVDENNTCQLIEPPNQNMFKRQNNGNFSA
ncbi:hypothetical protein A0J48_021360 [Sphaerospermopsis aphanizomenoides BCCUSP55]|uniref:hypothetical protein n=1 Tax=Sphaerospermopsis aphanizomenoides TaxID=459663 RepID=UPI001903C256|nr:hypothetical protein [Sphaerospermopsis aphanizomenoides]MBK1990044.1 hypothetical protein [Sphaerospermopsis aphanizomenoides BCCUSP55]